MKRVMLDAGHGGHDPGAKKYIVEKDTALKLALYTGEALAKGYEGIEVLYTRKTDKFISLTDRAAMANRADVDYFVSFHHNGGGGTGFESYIHPAAGARTVAYQNTVHAEIMAFLSKQGVRDRGKKRADYAVLRETVMSAILLENLFVDHSADATKLKDDKFLRGLAAAIARGIAKALGLKPKVTKPAQPEPKTDGVWIVQVGAFAKKASAEELAKEIKKKTDIEPYVWLKK